MTIYIYIYIHIHIYICAANMRHICKGMYIYMYALLYLYLMYVCMHVCMHGCKYVCMSVFMYVCTGGMHMRSCFMKNFKFHVQTCSGLRAWIV